MSPAKKISVRKRLVKKSVAQKNVVSPAQTTLPSPSLPLYRRLAMGFVVLVAIILLLILFVSTTKVTIQFVPEQTQVQVAFPVSLQAPLFFVQFPGISLLTGPRRHQNSHKT